MELLIELLKLSDSDLKKVLFKFLERKKMNPINEDGFLYAKGNIPVMLVAHMDTVFKNKPKNVFYDSNKDLLYNPVGGLGGDDRCGIYAIVRLLNKYTPYVLFTEDEEIGCIGASKAVEKLESPKIKYIIEFDRRGSNDCVFYDCGNKDFMEYVKSFGFEKQIGSFSDISILGSSWNIASVNLSSGYYNEHTINEYITFNQLENNIKRVEKMIKDIKNVKYFDYQEIVYKPYYNYNFNDIKLEDFLLFLDGYYESHKDIKRKRLELDDNEE